MLYVRFLAGAGGVLLALMLVANAYLPQSAAPASTGDDTHPTIRINSTRKGPERVVFDTSLPTTAAPASPTVPDAAPPPPAPTREAFAQMPDEPSERGAGTAAKPVTDARPPAPRPAHRHVARRGVEPPVAPQQRQFAGGFFPFWFR